MGENQSPNADYFHSVDAFEQELDERTGIADSACNLWRSAPKVPSDLHLALESLLEPPASDTLQAMHTDALMNRLQERQHRSEQTDTEYVGYSLAIMLATAEANNSGDPYPSADTVNYFIKTNIAASLLPLALSMPSKIPFSEDARMIATAMAAAQIELMETTIEGLRAVTESLYGANTWSLFADESSGLSWFDAVTAYQDATS